MPLHAHLDVEIARRATPGADLALPRELDPVAVVDARRDVDRDGAPGPHAAVAAAVSRAEAGDTVLLAPAAASLDMYEGMGQRGDMFAAAARELALP